MPWASITRLVWVVGRGWYAFGWAVLLVMAALGLSRARLMGLTGYR